MLSDQGSSTTDFGDLLLRLRLAAGLSREALAERAGLSATGIGALERGQRRAPHADTVRRLSEALQLSPDDAAALARAVVRHRAPHVQAPAAPLSVTNSPALIAPLGPLVGRGWDVAVVCGLLRADDTRFVTLTGPAGVGKTRSSVGGRRAPGARAAGTRRNGGPGASPRPGPRITGAPGAIRPARNRGSRPGAAGAGVQKRRVLILAGQLRARDAGGARTSSAPGRGA